MSSSESGFCRIKFRRRERERTNAAPRVVNRLRMECARCITSNSRTYIARYSIRFQVTTTDNGELDFRGRETAQLFSRRVLHGRERECSIPSYTPDARDECKSIYRGAVSPDRRELAVLSVVSNLARALDAPPPSSRHASGVRHETQRRDRIIQIIPS